MTDFLEQLQRAYIGYFGNGFYAFLLLLVVGVSMVTLKAWNKKEVFIRVPAAIIVITLLNPVYYKLADKAADYAYARSYWYIPFFFILAFLMSVLIRKIADRSKKNATMAVIIICMIIWGQTMFSNETFPFKLEKNIYKMPDDVIEICDYISSQDSDGPIVLAPTEISRYARVYDANIRNYVHGWSCEVYSDNPRVESAKLKINEQINIERPNIDYLMDFALDSGCDYVVFAKTQNIGDRMEQYGECVRETENYLIYKLI